jgi:RHS repeat-associated protein
MQGFLYDDQLRIVAELNGSNAVVSQFVYATNANVPDYMIRGGVNYRLIKDHLGSVRLVLKTTDGTQPTTPTAAGVVIAYDAFGNVDPSHSNAFAGYAAAFQPFGFAGGLYDSDTKLLRFGERDYDPETARWVSKDPIRFNGSPTNLYEYVESDPVNRVDPSGKGGGVEDAAEECLQSGYPPLKLVGGILLAVAAVQACIASGVCIPEPPKDPCYAALYACLERPWSKGNKNDCGACFRECEHAGGAWPYYKCPE